MIDKNVEGMEYLNNFSPNTLILLDADSVNAFKSYIQTGTFMNERYQNPKQDHIKLFDPDKIVLDEGFVYMEVLDYKDEPVRELFKVDAIPGLIKPEFNAGEMFYRILQLEKKVNGDGGFFKRVEYIGTENFTGGSIKVYRAIF